MIYSNYIEICKKALEQGNFISLFRGEQGLSIPCRPSVSNCPTDWEILITFGLYELYNQTRDSRILRLSYETLEKMSNPLMNALDIWCAYNTYFVFARNETDYTAPFHIIDSKLTEQFQEAIIYRQNELTSIRMYRGSNYSDGLWGDIKSSLRFLKKYKIDIQNDLKRGDW